jgi:hypothetical protein
MGRIRIFRMGAEAVGGERVQGSPTGAPGGEGARARGSCRVRPHSVTLTSIGAVSARLPHATFSVTRLMSLSG